VSTLSRWYAAHPKDPNLAIIKAVKRRGGAREQIALSLRRPQFHMLRIIEKMIEMTTPLRDELLRQIAEVEGRDSHGINGVSQQRALEVMRMKARSPWLWLGKYGLDKGKKNSEGWWIAAPGIAGLSDTLRAVISRHDVRDAEGSPFNITVSDFRDAWIGYVYQKSGYSWLIAKLAAGHKSSTAISHYLRQRRWRVAGEDQYVSLQTAMWEEIRSRRVLDAVVLRALVQQGRISDEQRLRWKAHKDRTRMGMGCLNPKRPPASLVPNHPEGDICTFQRCVLCHQGIIFSDSLDGLTRRQSELRYIQETTPTVAWLQSSWPDELEVLEQNLRLFDSCAVQERAQYWLEEIRAGRAYVFDQEGLPNAR
jgi:hypothetical protein